MLFDFGAILVFLIFGALFVGGNLILSRIIQTRNPHPVKISTYECGELPEGQSWIQFNIRFYVIALAFLIFEVEIVFLFPWAVVFKDLGGFAFVEMMIFVAILLVGLAYLWAKGDLEWDKPKQVPAPELLRESQSSEPAKVLVS
ncbi:MAG: NADH-quinone oxidoreductase subunit A [Calditrichaeota bacterium]|nr:MAG: NADH-quinone oxidoreductase subunit A [Calditrichota bacterium]